MRRSSPLLAFPLAALVAVACSSPTNVPASDAPASTPGVPGSSEIAEATPRSSVSPAPNAAPSALPSVPPWADLADVLPDYAGPELLDKQPVSAEELLVNQDQLGFGQMLVALRLERDQFEAAAASATDIGLLAVRADGVSGVDLADAFVEALLGRYPDGTLTEQVVHGITLRRIAVRVEDEEETVTVLPLGDALVVAAAPPDQGAIVQRTLRRMVEPGPERLLPTTLDDRALEVIAMPGEAFPTGGDVCAIVCPGELQAMAVELGVDITDVRLAYGGLQNSPAIAVIAFEFPGTDVEDLIALREKLGRYDSSYERSDLTIDGKQVRRYHDTSSVDPIRGTWEYAKDGVLYLLYAETAGDGIPPLVEEALGKLP
jgi:hypothetical protein